MINAYPGGHDGMAASLGLTPAALSNRMYELKGQQISVNQALAMQELSGSTAFAEYVARRADGTFTKLPDFNHLDRDELLSMFNRFHSRVGELSAKFERFAADGEFDRREREDFDDTTNEIHKSLSSLHAVVLALYCRDEVGAHG